MRVLIGRPARTTCCSQVLRGRVKRCLLNGYIVEVEADIGQTLPAFIILGLPDASLNEAKERIRSAAL